MIYYWCVGKVLYHLYSYWPAHTVKATDFIKAISITGKGFIAGANKNNRKNNGDKK